VVHRQKSSLKGEANEDGRIVRSTGLEPVTLTVSRRASRGAKAQAHRFHFSKLGRFWNCPKSKYAAIFLVQTITKNSFMICAKRCKAGLLSHHTHHLTPFDVCLYIDWPAAVLAIGHQVKFSIHPVQYDEGIRVAKGAGDGGGAFHVYFSSAF
jgi:hypothetical protein